MNNDLAECNNLQPLLSQLGEYLDEYLSFDHKDAMEGAKSWQSVLGQPLPEQGIGIEQVVNEMGRHVISNASQIPNPGCTSFITTGATSIGALATLAGAVAAPQRIGMHAFNFLEDLSLQWLAELFQLPASMQGIYSSGGSVANLLALGAARQSAFEKLGIDPAKDGVSGVQQKVVVFASAESHHSVQRACAVLGLGRDALIKIPCDDQGRLRVDLLEREIQTQLQTKKNIPMAIVGNLGTTNAGAIDPVSDLVDIAQEYKVWLHLDGAYGLPGILDPDVAPFYKDIEHVDSLIVDPHKWMGAPVGIGATFVRDGELLQRAFTQEPADYLEGTLSENEITHSLDHLGVAYGDMGVELSAPSRGAVVWALIREIGKHGMVERVRRHNGMAKAIANRVKADKRLELLREPTLSICCFRYVDDRVDDLDQLNQLIHRQLIHNSVNMPSTTVINGKLAIRPCFIGARTTWQHAESLIEEVIQIGDQLVAEKLCS